MFPVGALRGQAGGRRSGRVGWIVAMITAYLLLPSLVLAQDPVDGLAFRSAADPVDLEFKVDGNRASAGLSVVLVNGSDSEVSVRYGLIDLDAGVQYTPGDTGSIAFAATEAPDRIGAGEAVPVRFTITVPATATSFEGFVIAQADGITADPAMIRVSGKIASSANPLAKATLEPESLSVTVTRMEPTRFAADSFCWAWPPVDGSAFEVHAAGIATLPDPSASPSPSPSADPATTLASDTGGRLHASLHIVNRDDGRRVLAVRLSCAPATGTYTGTITLDPGNDESPKLGLRIKVQKLFIYPLLVVVGGSYVG